MEEYYKIIADQAVELKQLREKIEQYKTVFSKISTYLYCVGGPLNDNVCLYTNRQRVTFWRIAAELESNEKKRQEILEWLKSDILKNKFDLINGYEWSKERDGKIKIHWEK